MPLLIPLGGLALSFAGGFFGEKSAANDADKKLWGAIAAVILLIIALAVYLIWFRK